MGLEIQYQATLMQCDDYLRRSLKSEGYEIFIPVVSMYFSDRYNQTVVRVEFVPPRIIVDHGIVVCAEICIFEQHLNQTYSSDALSSGFLVRDIVYKAFKNFMGN